MPPSGPGKRKRGDHTYAQDNGSRPSPYRPGNVDLARHSPAHSPSRNGSEGQNRGRGYRRGSRGGSNAINSSASSANHTAEQQSTPSRQQSSRPTPTPTPTPTPAPAPTSNTVTTRPIANPTPAPVPEEPLPDRPFDYQYITGDVREAWETLGKDTIQSQAAQAVQEGDDVALQLLLQEVVQSVCVRSIPAVQAGEALRPIIVSEDEQTASHAQNALLDCVSIYAEDHQSIPARDLSDFLAAAGMSEDLLRLEMDQPLLLKLGLIGGRFKQISIRKTTNMIYRQANFNLMREESEGFAKLITELFMTSGNQPPTREVVRQTVEKIKALIGAFDLDVGRSLDVVLDVFGSVLVRHFRFLVRLLRASPWWPQMNSASKESLAVTGLPAWADPEESDISEIETAKEEMLQAVEARDIAFWPDAQTHGLLAFQQVGRVRATAEDIANAQSKSDTDFRSQWICDTKTLPPSGNRDAAQLLGFKLRFYSSSAARDPTENLPDNLIHLSALLIKIGFISLNDLYPHIWRTDEEMEDLKQVKVKEKEERERAARPGAGTKNALAMAGALADDTIPMPAARLRDPTTRASTPSRDAEIQKPATTESSTEPADQKVTLLKSLLAIGALPEALFILGRFPWIIDLYPEVPEYIHRILHHCLNRIYSQLRPLHDRHSLSIGKPSYETNVPGASKGQVNLVDSVPKKVLKWANLDRNDSGDGTDYRFYWDDWNDNIPVCRTIDDVFTLCRTLLVLVGVKIGQDPTLVLKLTRIGKHSLAQDTSELNKTRWLDLIKRVLLPSLSLTKSNAGVVNEVFDLMSQYPTSTRFVMYLDWSSGRTSRVPDIKAAFDQAKAETKDILKRISKTNVKPMARSLAKIAYANPHVVITTALTQIEVYDSIAEVFVEGARYFTDLGYDVLTWAMISSMSRAGRSRVQDGGLFASRWLSALSQFAGKIYKRYGMMKPGPILQYVADQLQSGNSTDLKMLEQVVSSMGGIANDNNFNDTQLLAMGGGPLLQAQTILQLLDRRNEARATSKRLVKSLSDHALTAQLLITMAQQRTSCAFVNSDVPLKAIANTFDEITRVMTQYLDLLRANLTSEDFETTIPDIADLLIDFQIPAEIAFWISRPVLSKRIAKFDHESSEMQKANGSKTNGEDVDMEDPDNSEEDGEAIDVDDAPVSVATPSEYEANGIEDPSSSGDGIDKPEQWHPVLQPLMERLNDSLPEEVVNLIGVGFYVTFWQLSLYDIYVPSKAYEDEMGRQKKKIAAITSDRSNVSAASARQREATIRSHQQLIDELLKENRQHLKAYNETRARLGKEKEQWFANKRRAANFINPVLWEHCFLPRILASPQDAFFCFKFLKYLHSTGTPNFRTLGLYDAFLKTTRLVSLMFMCTSQESENVGRFLRESIQDFARWHKSKAVYEREAFGSKRNLIGFAMLVENGKAVHLMEHEQFQQILFKWHSKLHAALITCLESSEYMHVRNAITVLRAISTVFPAVKWHGIELQKAVGKLRNSEREDLKTASAALLGALHRREKEWILPNEFVPGMPKKEGEVLSTSNAKVNNDEGSTERPRLHGTQETGRVEMVEVALKNERGDSRIPAEPIRATTRAVEVANGSVRSASREPAALHSVGDGSRSERRSGRTLDVDRTTSSSRRFSPPPRHAPPVNLATSSEPGSRNGYRDSPRPTRAPPSEQVRPDAKINLARQGHTERLPESPHEPPHHYTRGPERPPHIDREERPHRRDHEPRQDERRPPSERDPRGERDSRAERDRNQRGGGRDYNHVQNELERKRPDLLDGRRSATSSGRAALQPSAGGVNPERAAQIAATEPRPNISIRGQAQEKPRTSRPSSPRRDEGRQFNERSERQERSERPERADRPERPDRPDRGDRPERFERPDRRPEAAVRSNAVPTQGSTRPAQSGGFNRDSRQQHSQPIDMSHGRLEPESPQRSSVRHDRPADSDVPSGPRSRPAQGSRGRAPLSGGLTSADRPLPTGPSRHSRDASGPEPSIKSQDPAGGVHPDRLNQIAAAEPPRAPQQRSSQGPPPSGPRNTTAPPPSGPSPVSRGIPTGPQVDGAGRGRRNPIDNVNSTLAQAQGNSGRGRGAMRQVGGPGQAQMHQPGPGSRTSFGVNDSSNPNDMPVQPRPPSRRDSAKDLRLEGEGRSARHRGEHEGRFDDARRNERREDQQPSREPRGPRVSQGDDLPARKHPREDGAHYGGGYSRNGARNASESKRPRRGG